MVLRICHACMFSMHVVHGVVLGVVHASCACLLCMLVVHAAWPSLYLSVAFLPQGIMLNVNAQCITTLRFSLL